MIRVLLINLVFSFSLIADDNIVLWKRNYDTPFFRSVIELAAQLTEDNYGPYSLSPSVELEQGRAFFSLHGGDIVNVVIAGISSERERMGIPIYFPVDRGLLGFRVCLQRGNDMDYVGINSLDDLKEKNVLIGVGTHWPDRHVFEESGLRVAHSPVYGQLFEMLRASRFDCFLRSFNEVQRELGLRENSDFRLEQNLAIVYPSADFVFVSLKDKRLKRRLEEGLKLAFENGQFYELFQYHFKEALYENRLYERKILFLDNADLSTPARDAINEFGLASFAARYTN